MPLSKDPEARARQLAALHKYRAQAQKKATLAKQTPEYREQARKRRQKFWNSKKKSDIKKQEACRQALDDYRYKALGKRANKKRSKTLKEFWATPEGQAVKKSAAKNGWKTRDKGAWVAICHTPENEKKYGESLKRHLQEDPEFAAKWWETHRHNFIAANAKPNRHEEIMRATRAAAMARTQEITVAELRERAAWALKDYDVDILPDMPAEYYKEIIEYFRPDLADFSNRDVRLT